MELKQWFKYTAILRFVNHRVPLPTPLYYIKTLLHEFPLYPLQSIGIQYIETVIPKTLLYSNFLAFLSTCAAQHMQRSPLVPFCEYGVAKLNSHTKSWTSKTSALFNQKSRLSTRNRHISWLQGSTNGINALSKLNPNLTASFAAYIASGYHPFKFISALLRPPKSLQTHPFDLVLNLSSPLWPK